MWKLRAPTGRLALLPALLTVAACAAGPGQEPATVSGARGGTVIQGDALLDGRGSVLDALRGKVPGLKIQEYVGDCPRIALRNDATFRTPVNPHVYVDGTRATDTCILESLWSRDVESVEVYPAGVSGRPGYPSHAHGLILVFLRS